MKKTTLLSLLLALACLVTACGAQPASGSSGSPESPESKAQSAAQESAEPSAEGEALAQPGEGYRAMWVSYLEWESFDFSSQQAFRAEADQLMENCKQLGLNTVIAQVRPFGDALYPSRYFPWSHLCTGTQGQDPGFDPLAQLVESAHAAGLELEAWVNPYRIRLNKGRPAGELAAENPVSRNPAWAKQVGEGIYLDPANEDARRWVVAGVVEIVEKYEVDGIHFDDYFYPTTDPSFDKDDYDPAFGSLEEWRRQNVDRLMQDCYRAIKKTKPSVRFGVSPQGNMENNYNGQYSDVSKWLATPGYVDYVMPQIYWGYGFQLQSGSDRYSFPNITAQWAQLERAPSVQLYFGLGAYRIGVGDGGSNPDSVSGWQTGHVLADQARDSLALADGYALYRYDFLYKNAEWAELAAQEIEALKAQNAQNAA